jgi:hypothetical protein
MEKGTIIYAPIVPPNDLDQFPTHLANLGKGGLHFKNNLGAIQSIAAALREQGMLAYDKSTDKYYKLNQAGAWVEFSVAGGAAGVISTTYANLVTLINTSALTPGAFYKITDFRTIHYFFDNDDTIDAVNDACPIEQLIVMAIGTNKIGREAYSADFPNDIIHYDWNPVNFRADKGFALNITQQEPDAYVFGTIIPDFRGVITYRHDTVQNVSAYFDFRNVTFRRWNLATLPVWDEEQNTSYNGGACVQRNNQVYRSLYDDNSEWIEDDGCWFRYPEIDLAIGGMWSAGSTIWNGIPTPDSEDYENLYVFDFYRGASDVHILPYTPYYDNNTSYHRLCNIIFLGLQQTDGMYVEDGAFVMVGAVIDPWRKGPGTFNGTGGNYAFYNNALPKQTNEENAISRFLRNDGTWAVPQAAINYPGNSSQYLRGDRQWNVPFSPPNDTTKFLRGDGSWQVPPSLTYPNDITKFLRGDGSWQLVTATAVSALIALANNVLDIAWSNMGVYTAYISSTVTLAFTSRGYGFISIRINMESAAIINLPAWVSLISGEFIPGSYNLLQIVSFTNSGTDSGSAWAIITQQQ